MVHLPWKIEYQQFDVIELLRAVHLPRYIAYNWGGDERVRLFSAIRLAKKGVIGKRLT